jgi:RsiW-degrading membrane proteinase PrsW (M82 family)
MGLQLSLPIIFGILPTFAWLLFYLNKDLHPEPKRMIAKVFFLGMFLSVGAAVLVELGITQAILIESNVKSVDSLPIFQFIIYNFLAIALVEEIAKFAVVKFFVFKHKEFDEPVDTMIYMVTAALGFAALENILVLSSLRSALMSSDMVMVALLRFLGATLLHTLASATLGYFIALSFCNAKSKQLYIATGLILSVFLHGLYNMSLLKSEEIASGLYQITNLKIFTYPLYIPSVLLIIFLIIVSIFFKKISTDLNIFKFSLLNKNSKV